MFPALAATVMSDSRPATELLYAKMMPAEQASKCQGTFNYRAKLAGMQSSKMSWSNSYYWPQIQSTEMIG